METPLEEALVVEQAPILCKGCGKVGWDAIEEIVQFRAIGAIKVKSISPAFSGPKVQPKSPLKENRQPRRSKVFRRQHRKVETNTSRSLLL